MKQTQDEAMLEEISSARNLVEKDMLLQKYGLIAPKLTPFEKSLVTKQAIIYYRIKEVA